MSLLLGLLVAALAGYAGGRWHALVRPGAASARNSDVKNAGEAAVRRLLLTEFNDPAYHLLNNITIPVDDGTTQIDHILVSRYGVFVIETKHYSGWIFGNAKSSTWTRVKFRAKSKFQNPLHQNYKHLQVVKGLLHFVPAEHIHSLVVFTGDAIFKTERPPGVVHLDGLPGAIRQHEEVIMEENTLQFCLGRIEFYRFYISGVTDAEHQAYLNRKFGDPMESGVQQRGKGKAAKASP
jgi:hypothetical protein